MSGAVEIRGLMPSDYGAWLPLWTTNNQGQVTDEVTAVTWDRLISADPAVSGLAAWRGEDLAGFVHAIVHPVTGHIAPVCYMQDLFVGEAFRKQGIARALVAALAGEARRLGYARLYWLAEADNAAAQALYTNLGYKLDFTFHVLPL